MEANRFRESTQGQCKVRRSPDRHLQKWEEKGGPRELEKVRGTAYQEGLWEGQFMKEGGVSEAKVISV